MIDRVTFAPLLVHRFFEGSTPTGHCNARPIA